MEQVLQGKPQQLFESVEARYIPLRDSRVHAEPEANQRRLLKNTGKFLFGGGALLELGLLVTGNGEMQSYGFGLLVLAIAAALLYLSRRPLKYIPPEPLINLAALSQSLGLCRQLKVNFPEQGFELNPVTGDLCAITDGRKWTVKVDHQTLKPLEKDSQGYESYSLVHTKNTSSSEHKIWNRNRAAGYRQRVLWTVTIEGAFTPRAGQPSRDTVLDSSATDDEQSICTFSLPIISFEEPGLGHENRTDYISSPAGLHHPEFVGEQVALSLAWLFPANFRLL